MDAQSELQSCDWGISFLTFYFYERSINRKYRVEEDSIYKIESITYGWHFLVKKKKGEREIVFLVDHGI